MLKQASAEVGADVILKEELEAREALSEDKTNSQDPVLGEIKA